MKTKKLLSLLLALMMMLSVVPFYASAATALSASNVTEWPTASGEIFYGQTVGEGITLSGGKVVYNGVEVPGKFVHWNDAFRPTSVGDASKANLKFVPDDTTTYKGFNKLMSTDTTYKVKKTTAIFADENDLPIASSIKSGQTLSSSTITGGAMINPYYAEESTMKGATWQWVNPDAVITESGEYDAYFSVVEDRYESISRKIYVEVEVDTFISEVKTLPSVENLEYTTDITWKDVVLTGGTVVVKDTDTEVEGTFAVTDLWANVVPKVGTYEIDIVFTPIDTEKYTTAEMKVPVTVKPAKVAFIDEAGTETIPEITVPYGLKMGDDISGYLKPYLNGTASFNYEETEYYNEYIPVGTHELTVKTICDDPNYERYNTLTFKLTVEPVETAVTVKYDINKDNKNTYEIYVVKADVDSARPQGDFAIYVDGQLLKDGAKCSEHITWSPEKSKAYTVKVVYTPTANDPCLVADTEITVDAKLYRNITTVNTISDGEKQFRCGEKIQVAANVPEFSGWVITDAAGNTVDLGVDLSAKSIEFAVPDFDVKLEAKGKTSSGTTGGGIFDMDLGSLTEGDSEWAIINIIRNLIAMFKSFLQQLIETFQSIGD